MSYETRFYEIEPTRENYWRAIILFGRNVASYKFALAKTLYELRNHPQELIRMDELAPVFAKHITEHLKLCDRQATSGQSRFLDVCRSFNNGEIQESKFLRDSFSMSETLMVVSVLVINSISSQKVHYCMI